MQLLLADLFCPNCRAYAHPFLERCPGCGAPRSPRYDEALGDRAGGPSLVDDPAYEKVAGEVSAKYVLSAHRAGMVGAMGAEGVVGADGTAHRGPAPFELADELGSQLTYRGAGFAAAGTLDVDMRVEADAVKFLDGKRQVLETVEAALILAVVPLRAGSADPPAANAGPAVTPLGATPDAPPSRGARRVDGDRIVVRWHAAGDDRQVAAGNRGGFLSARARFEHYLDLARWIGATSAASAQARWRAIGAAAYATEVGLRAAAPPEPSDLQSVLDRIGAASSGAVPATAHRSARERLEELEALRAAALVTPDEYDEKRREILASL